MKRERIIKRGTGGPNTAYRQLKDGSYKVHSWRITQTPTERFPELVTIENAGLEITKRFVTFDSAVRWIEGKQTEKLVDTSGRKVTKELKSIGMGPLINELSFGNVKNFSYIDINQQRDVDDPSFWS
jgi:hypothetical protein